MLKLSGSRFWTGDGAEGDNFLGLPATDWTQTLLCSLDFVL